MAIHLTIRDIKEIICDTDIANESTVGDLKAVVAEFKKSNSLSELSLVFRGEVLDDERTLSSYNIKDGSTIFVFSKKKKENVENNKVETQVKQQPNSPNNSFTELMNSPLGKSMMNMIQNNPQAYADMLRSNPIFNQIAENNPQLQHILNDSDMLSEQMELFLNPNNQNQTARTMDRMLDAVESMPGGFQALSKQINDLQEPLIDGIMDQFKGSGTKTNIDSKPLSKPSEEPIPFQNPQTNSPFSMFGMPGMPQLNLSPEMTDWMSNQNFPFSIQGTPAPSVQSVQNVIPSEALDLISDGIEKCQSKGLNVADLPGFKELADLIQATNQKRAEYEKIYADQLKIMNEMGFYDNEVNIKVLIQANGDVDQAIELLLTQRSDMY